MVLSAGVAALLVLTSACGGGKDGGDGKADATPAADRTPTGVVTRAEAKKVLAHYVEVNNRANKKADGKLLAQVEGDALLAQDQADYHQKSAWTAEERAEMQTPFDYVTPTFHIPSKDSAAWFAVTAESHDDKGSHGRNLLVFDRPGGKGSWKLVSAVWLGKKIAPPVPAKDKNGFAVPVADTGKKRGTVAPAGLTASLQDHYVTGGKKKGEVFAPSEGLRRIAQQRTRTKRALAPYAAVEWEARKISYKKIYALRLKDGGTLTWFNSGIREYNHGVRMGTHVNPSPQMAVYVGKKERFGFRLDHLYQSAAVVPRTGKAELLGNESRMVKTR